ncbi:hypothetical protein [Corynebacterium tuberculostearicum]|uniref:hypothetical protein n=1 Tax=Corynebacterium tuberculostearicum TaxID=38304 RepID=UPI002934795F|nr:hypothetical protein [Corynebacterium tuberculostearicum]MDV2433740.1 hypothetical protein [Corynebacterium tuberculostearicum]
MRFRSLTATGLILGGSLSLAACGGDNLDGTYEYTGPEGPSTIVIDGDSMEVSIDGGVLSGSVDKEDKMFTLEHAGVPGDKDSRDEEMEEKGAIGNQESFSTKDDTIILHGRSYEKVDD